MKKKKIFAYFFLFILCFFIDVFVEVSTYKVIIIKYLLYLIAFIFIYIYGETPIKNIFQHFLLFFLILIGTNIFSYVIIIGFTIRDILYYNFFNILILTGLFLISTYLIEIFRISTGLKKLLILFLIILNPFIIIFLALEIPYFNITFDGNGNKALLEMFDYENNADGKYKEWDESGKIIVEGKYKKGYKDGVWREYKNGNVIKEINYDTIKNKIQYKID